MELLTSTSFASAVASSKEQLKKISNIVSKYCGQAKAESFLHACGTLDFNTANDILDDTVEKLTGNDSVIMALVAFADKFSSDIPELDKEISGALFESDKVKAIVRYRSKIIDIIEQK